MTMRSESKFGKKNIWIKMVDIWVQYKQLNQKAECYHFDLFFSPSSSKKIN